MSITTMKKKVHPNYYPAAKVRCTCGHEFTMGSTVPEMTVEVCSACHPYFTGKQKFIDTAGRIDKFKKRYGK